MLFCYGLLLLKLLVGTEALTLCMQEKCLFKCSVILGECEVLVAMVLLLEWM